MANRLEVFLSNASREQINHLITRLKGVNDQELDHLIQALEKIV